MAHPIFADDMREIVESFIVETQEILDGLDHDLLALEQHADDADLIDRIFRAVHTVKGTSGFLGLEQLGILSHHFEDVLNRLRRRELAVGPGLVDVLFGAFDQMKVLFAQVVQGRLEPVDCDATIAALQAVAEDTCAPAAPEAASEPPAPDGSTASEPPAVVEAAPAAPAAPRAEPAETVRVEVDRLDALLNLVGELVLGRNRLLQLTSESDGSDLPDRVLRDLVDTGAQIDAITTELQAAVMRTRMTPIGRVFNKFPRVVRDLARTAGKEIELEIVGEDTELDKSLIEEIADPLVHMVRNAVDHGIEPPEVRRARGKPARGRIRMAAAHQGNQIVVTIEDDGAGLDPDRLRRRAVERGLLTGQEAAELSDAEAYHLIFRPGFSTAETVSELSGRGVGMDVVRTNVTRLNGTIAIDSEIGRGTRFVLKLPLTLAIIQSLLVRSGGETFALPLHAVVEVVALTGANVNTIRGREVLRLREEILPLLSVSTFAGHEQATGEGPRYAVVVGIADRRLGLVVDDLVGQKEIVVKPLGSYLPKIAGLAGTTILGDGRVVMILDVGELVRLETESLHAAAAA